MRAVKEVRDKLGAQAVATAMPEEPTSKKIVGYPARVRQFLHDVRLEMRNVTWPGWPDVQATTVVVLIATFFFGFYLGFLLDRILFAPLITRLLTAAKELLR